MKRLFSNLKVLCLTLLLLFNFNVTAGAQSFKDLSSKHWAYNAVTEMTDLGVINGYTDGTFKPSNHVTRAEFAKLLVVTLDLDGTKNTNPLQFEDVKETYWGYDYIKSAGNYLTGYKVSNKLYFYPTNDAVREDMAVAMVVASGLSNVEYSESTLSKFSDINKASSSLKKYIAIAVEHGLMNGNSNGTFNPKGTLTRAEAAQLMLNFVKSEKVSLEDLDKKIDENKDEPILHEQYGYIDLGTDYSKYEYEDDGTWHAATSRYLHKSPNKKTGTCNNFYYTDVTIREIKNPNKTYSFKVPYVSPIKVTYDKTNKQVDLGENWHAYDILSLDVDDLSKATKSEIKWVKAPERYIKKGSTNFKKAYLFVRYEETDKTTLTDNYIRVGEDDKLTWKETSKVIEYKGSSYQITEENGKVYLTVGLGSRSSGGYTIEIADVKITGKDIVIDVQETKPNPKEITTQSITYPCVTIELSLVPNSVKVNKLTPKVRGIDELTWKETTKTFTYKSKGHQFNTEDGKTYITVGLGSRKTGGYKVEIVNVKIDGENITLDVQETTPSSGETVTSAITYPTATIEVSRKPDKVVLNWLPVITPEEPALTWKETTKSFSKISSAYEITEEDGKVYLTVGIGSRNTGGYSVKIVDVKVNGGDIELDIQETMPGLGEMTTQAFTYPTATIELSRKPDSVKINTLPAIRRGEKITLTWSDTTKKIKYEGDSYLVTQEDGKVYLTVGMGMKKSDQYSIEITNVKIDGENVTLDVRETVPENGGLTSQETYYPTDTIELSGKPKSVIINKTTKEIPSKQESALTWKETNKSFEPNGSSYRISEEDGKVYLTVFGREQNTGGYSINFANISIEGRDITIDAQLICPGPGDAVTQAFATPKRTIELSGKPDTVTINWLPNKIRGQEDRLMVYVTDEKFTYVGTGYTINKKNGKTYVTIGKGGEKFDFDLLLHDWSVDGKNLNVTVYENTSNVMALSGETFSSNITLEVSIEPEEVNITYLGPNEADTKNLSYRFSDEEFTYSLKGYKNVTQNKKHYVVIGGGKQKNPSNVKVEIVSVGINGKNVSIIANIVPDSDADPNVAATYPTKTLQFSEKPSSVIIYWNMATASLSGF